MARKSHDRPKESTLAKMVERVGAVKEYCRENKISPNEIKDWHQFFPNKQGRALFISVQWLNSDEEIAVELWQAFQKKQKEAREKQKAQVKGTGKERSENETLIMFLQKFEKIAYNNGVIAAWPHKLSKEDAEWLNENSIDWMYGSFFIYEGCEEEETQLRIKIK